MSAKITDYSFIPLEAGTFNLGCRLIGYVGFSNQFFLNRWYVGGDVAYVVYEKVGPLAVGTALDMNLNLQLECVEGASATVFLDDVQFALV